MTREERIRRTIDPHKAADRRFFLDLLDGDVQLACENEHIAAVMGMLKIAYIDRLGKEAAEAERERDGLVRGGDRDAESYRRIVELGARAEALRRKIDGYRPFFTEPYFARMDVFDDREGYNSYYIGKRGDVNLEIVDWRAPLARRYYQKSKTGFSINEYDYRVVLRRAIRAHNGKVLGMQDEYLNLTGFLPDEETAGLGDKPVLDPYLREILESRKEKKEVVDIIETIQEKQYEIITLPEDDEFVVQGVAGSGKTMIMLHRLSYLMYNDESIRPENVLVITPSDSFNEFIDELSAVLELEKVRTSTLNDYYARMLSGCGIDLSGRVDYDARVPEGYLAYVYSDAFPRDVDGEIGRWYDALRALLSGDGRQPSVSSLMDACDGLQAEFDRIKNASVRVRRCVLGEMRERKDGGGLYYTKQFRYLFNAVSDVAEVLGIMRGGGRMDERFYFFRQMVSFGRSVRVIGAQSSAICADALKDLEALKAAIERETGDLKRYRSPAPGAGYTYRDRIDRNAEILAEADSAAGCVRRMDALFSGLRAFCDRLCADPGFAAVSACESVGDLAFLFYDRVAGPAKAGFGVPGGRLDASDPFALCLILSEMGYALTPKFSYVFVDEGQDISPSEYALLRRVNDRARFNVFGDLKQNMTPWRGVGDWDALGLRKYDLNLNYRNTNQIVRFVADELGADMRPIGFDGGEVEHIAPRDVTRFLSGSNGLRAVITSESALPAYTKKSYNVLRESGRISRSKINVMTVYESKGLEFTAVAVADGDMTESEKYIAYTRALRDLAVVRAV